jgi:two-component system, chemotaxis family, chemotaxis protein CheY
MATSGKRILVADDQHMVTRLLTILLAKLGFEDVVIVHDGEAALERLRSERFDAVLADIKMEPMSGFHLVSAMRKDERLAKMPVVLMTGANDPSLPVAAKRVRADGFLMKPFTPLALRQQFERVMASA